MLVVVFSHNLNFSEDDHNEEDCQELGERREVNFAEMTVSLSDVSLEYSGKIFASPRSSISGDGV